MKNGMATAVADQKTSPITLRFPNPSQRPAVADRQSSRITLRFPNPNKQQASVQKPKRIKSKTLVPNPVAKAPVPSKDNDAKKKESDKNGNATLYSNGLFKLCCMLSAELSICALLCALLVSLTAILILSHCAVL